GALQVNAVRSEISGFERVRRAQALLERKAPLLNVLRRSVRIERSKTDGGLSQDRLAEIKVRSNDACCRNEVVALLTFRKYIRHVVALIAPRVHIDGREKDAVRRVNHDALARQMMR